ncbi:MAG: HAD-IA family hydrolase [Deltaproteobacteria bacterium]|nr:HAD-IA family hydrolase [Deltaproteobacteria bacterium]
MPIRLVVMDCDGVLFDSEDANIAFYNEVLRRCGEPPMLGAEQVACHALASAQLFVKYYGDRPELLARMQATAKELDYGPFYRLMSPKPLLRSVLAELRSGYAMAMATNRGQTTHGVLGHFQLETYFDLAVGVLDVPRPKPHPDMLLHCLEHFSLRADEAIFVGDQATDAECAQAAGLRFVGIGPVAAVSPLRVAELAELPALLARLA